MLAKFDLTEFCLGPIKLELLSTFPGSMMGKSFLFSMATLQAAANYQEEVRIFKKFHGSVIGRGGATLRKIRDETDTKIELPQENSDNDMIRIIGRKENVEKARARILAIEKDMVSILCRILTKGYPV